VNRNNIEKLNNIEINNIEKLNKNPLSIFENAEKVGRPHAAEIEGMK